MNSNYEWMATNLLRQPGTAIVRAGGHSPQIPTDCSQFFPKVAKAKTWESRSWWALKKNKRDIQYNKCTIYIYIYIYYIYYILYIILYIYIIYIYIYIYIYIDIPWYSDIPKRSKKPKMIGGSRGLSAFPGSEGRWCTVFERSNSWILQMSNRIKFIQLGNTH